MFPESPKQQEFKSDNTEKSVGLLSISDNDFLSFLQKSEDDPSQLRLQGLIMELALMEKDEMVKVIDMLSEVKLRAIIYLDNHKQAIIEMMDEKEGKRYSEMFQLVCERYFKIRPDIEFA